MARQGHERPRHRIARRPRDDPVRPGPRRAPQPRTERGHLQRPVETGARGRSRRGGRIGPPVVRAHGRAAARGTPHGGRARAVDRVPSHARVHAAARVHRARARGVRRRKGDRGSDVDERRTPRRVRDTQAATGRRGVYRTRPAVGHRRVAQQVLHARPTGHASRRPGRGHVQPRLRGRQRRRRGGHEPGGRAGRRRHRRDRGRG